jgi:hypothetical protein
MRTTFVLLVLCEDLWSGTIGNVSGRCTARARDRRASSICTRGLAAVYTLKIAACKRICGALAHNTVCPMSFHNLFVTRTRTAMNVQNMHGLWVTVRSCVHN